MKPFKLDEIIDYQRDKSWFDCDVGWNHVRINSGFRRDVLHLAFDSIDEIRL